MAMIMIDEEQIIQFPCMFPIKIMGLNTEEFSSSVMAIFYKHLDPDRLSSSSRTSSGGKYLSMTITFMAKNRAQLDAIYNDLNAHELVLMTL